MVDKISDQTPLVSPDGTEQIVLAKGGLNYHVLISDLLSGSAPVSHSHPKADVGLDQVDNTSDINKPISTLQQAALDDKADLVGGVIPTAQLPAIAITEFLGSVADEPTMLALSGQKGDFCIRNDDGLMWIIVGNDSSIIGGWLQTVHPSGDVFTVNGQVGVVILGKTDIGLSNVDNTSDANKPVSTDQQTALDLKSDATHTHVSSEVGLGNADNTSDADKPVSTAQDAAISGRVIWLGEWVDGSYVANDAVKDGPLFAIANQATTTRPSINLIGDAVHSMPPSTQLTLASDASIVRTVHNYVFSKAGYLREISIKVPVNYYNMVTNIQIIDNTNSKSFIVYNPPVIDGRWIIAYGAFNVDVAIDIDVVVESYVVSSPEITGKWTALLGITDPVAGEVYVDDFGAPTSISVASFDSDSVDNTTGLQAVVAGSILRLAEKSNDERFTQVKVLSVDTTDPIFTVYTVGLIYAGILEIRDTEPVNLRMDAPPINSSEYYVNTDYYLGSTNQPSFATITTKLYYDSSLQADVNDGYGIDVLFQEADISSDWDIIIDESAQPAARTLLTQPEVPLSSLKLDQSMSIIDKMNSLAGWSLSIGSAAGTDSIVAEGPNGEGVFDIQTTAIGFHTYDKVKALTATELKSGWFSCSVWSDDWTKFNNLHIRFTMDTGYYEFLPTIERLAVASPEGKDDRVNGEWRVVYWLGSEMSEFGGAPAFDSLVDNMTDLTLGINDATVGMNVRFGPLSFGIKNRPKISFSFDKSADTDIAIGKAILDRYGMTASFAVVGDNIGTATFLSLSQINSLISAGWSANISNVSSHVDDHAEDYDLILADINKAISFMVDNSIPTTGVYVYPEGDYAPNSILALRSLNIKKALTISNVHIPVNNSVRAYSHDLNITRTDTYSKTLANLKIEVDLAISRGGNLNFMMNRISNPALGVDTEESVFEALVEYVALKRDAGLCDVDINQEQYYR